VIESSLIAVQVFAGWLIADAMGGLFHLFTDRGWNIPLLVRQFQNHHDRPWTMTFDLEPVLGAIPLAFIAWFALPWLFGSMAVGVGFTQIPHYYIHHPEQCPVWMKLLQKTRIVLRPDSHEQHHRTFDRGFCILAGWNDWWIDRVARAIA